MTDTPERDRIVAVLLDHEPYADATRCECGYRPDTPVALLTHVADHVLDALADPVETVQVCSLCQRERTMLDAYDYHPLQEVTGQPLGWYSGDDGEVCPACLTQILRGQGR